MITGSENSGQYVLHMMTEIIAPELMTAFVVVVYKAEISFG
ncbi:hypothetical protein [Enterobacter cloacae complex sp. 301C7]